MNFMCRCFGTLCLFHLHRWCKQEEIKKGKTDEEVNNRISLTDHCITFWKKKNSEQKISDMESNFVFCTVQCDTIM